VEGLIKGVRLQVLGIRLDGDWLEPNFFIIIGQVLKDKYLPVD